LNKPIRRIAVVGAGTTGASWTALYLARGFNVVVADPDPSSEARLRLHVDTAWTALKVIGVSPKGSPEHLCFTSDPSAAAADADFIQESAPDRADVKIKLFAQLDAAAPLDSIIASSASNVPMSLMQSECAHPERCLIGHPFHPPHIVPLIEVVGGAKTSMEFIHRAMAFYTTIGRKPIHVRKEIVGHVANRLQAALYREVAHLIEQDVLDVGDIDAAVSWGPGLRWGVMGPNMLFHLSAGPGGIHHFMEHLARPIGECWKDLGSPDLTPELQQAIIEGVLQEAGSRSLAQLARERDELLVGLLRLRSKLSKAGGGKRTRSAAKRGTRSRRG
jgi:carnitine 3-dehydrogenase